ncbi:acyltransferase [Leptospira koniambonensis]|uniref:Acyltransferase n=1 Tax=Leptospira koniambonensis TaxID=2484950 RepID=A0A4R9J921_9LEPT|nr:acyltransferase [Leptospira koniambonensis]TGL35286.1 acyltransferase [Leptospira koniambonensis]
MKFLFSKNESEVPALNGLRALSIFLVILFHLGILKTDNDVIKSICQNLRTGVDLFFMLSGFLIYGGLLDENERSSKIDLKTFYLKRTLRIMPAYYLCILVGYIQSRHTYKLFEKIQNPTPDQIIAHESLGKALSNSWGDVLYISNYFPDRLFNYGWSLSIEEQFYLIVPSLCLFILFKLSNTTRRILIISVFFIPFLLRGAYYFAGLSKFWIDTHTETRFDAILVGMLIAEFVRWKPSVFKENKFKTNLTLSIGALVFLSVAFLTHRTAGNLVFLFTLFQIGYALLFTVSLIEGSFWNKFFSLSVFRPIARISYTMYLWHGAFITISIFALSNIFLIKDIGFATFLFIGIYSTLFVFLACIPIFYITERPFLALRDYLIKRMKRKKNEQ